MPPISRTPSARRRTRARRAAGEPPPGRSEPRRPAPDRSARHPVDRAERRRAVPIEYVSHQRLAIDGERQRAAKAKVVEAQVGALEVDRQIHVRLLGKLDDPQLPLGHQPLDLPERRRVDDVHAPRFERLEPLLRIENGRPLDPLGRSVVTPKERRRRRLIPRPAFGDDQLLRPRHQLVGAGAVGQRMPELRRIRRSPRLVVDGGVGAPQKRRQPGVRMVELEHQRVRPVGGHGVDGIPVPQLLVSLERAVTKKLEGAQRSRPRRTGRRNGSVDRDAGGIATPARPWRSSSAREQPVARQSEPFTTSGSYSATLGGSMCAPVGSSREKR